MDDNDIIVGLKNDNSKVIHYLYEKYSHEFTDYILKNSGTKEDAGDHFQECLILLWANIKNGTFTHQRESGFKGYFFSIFRFRWIDKLRKNHLPINDLEKAIEIPVDEFEEYFKQVRKNQEVIAMNKALKRMSEYERKILNWKYQDGYTAKQIKENLETIGEIKPENTINQNLHQARIKVALFAKEEIQKMKDDFQS